MLELLFVLLGSYLQALGKPRGRVYTPEVQENAS